MSTAAVFTIEKTWKQAKCPSTAEWIEKIMWYIYIWNIYNRILPSHSKEWNNAICCNMDGSRDYHTKWSKSKINTMWYHLHVESKIWHKYIEWSQTEEKYHMTSHIGGICKEMIQMNLFTKQKQTHRLQEGAYGCQVVGERWEEGIVREFGMGMYTWLYLKWVTFWRAHGTLLSVMWQTGWEGVSGRIDTWICMTGSLLGSPETITTLFINWLYPNWCFWTVMLEKTLESPLTSRRSNQSILKEISPGCSLEGLMLKLKLQYFGHLIGKDPDAGMDWGQEEKGTTEDEMAGWHHRLNGHGFE